jgi:hypothetical protein
VTATLGGFTSLPRPQPLWGTRTRLVAGAGWTVGGLIVVLAWWGVSGEATVGHQFHWLALGVVGVLVCLAAGATWLFAGMRAVGQRIRAVVPVPSDVRRPVRELRVVSEAMAADALVAAPGMRYFHRPSCTLARGKNVRPAERAEHLRDGRAPCGVCRPDVPAGVSAA